MIAIRRLRLNPMKRRYVDSPRRYDGDRTAEMQWDSGSRSRDRGSQSHDHGSPKEDNVDSPRCGDRNRAAREGRLRDHGQVPQQIERFGFVATNFMAITEIAAWLSQNRGSSVVKSWQTISSLWWATIFVKSWPPIVPRPHQTAPIFGPNFSLKPVYSPFFSLNFWSICEEIMQISRKIWSSRDPLLPRV